MKSETTGCKYLCICQKYQNIKVRLKIIMVSRESKLYELGLMVRVSLHPSFAGRLPHDCHQDGVSVCCPEGASVLSSLFLTLWFQLLATCHSHSFWSVCWSALPTLDSSPYFLSYSFPADSPCKGFLSTNITFLSWPYELCRGHPYGHGMTSLTMT